MPALPDNRRAAVLLDDKVRDLLRFVPKDEVDAFAGIYDDAIQMNKIAAKLGIPSESNFDFQLEWFYKQLDMGANRDGWRSNQVVDVTKQQREEDVQVERYMSPRYAPDPEVKRGIGLRRS